MATRAAAVLAIAVTLAQPALAGNEACPVPLRKARRLVLVTSGDMGTSSATVRLYRRTSPNDPWQRVGAPAPASIGRAGMAWGLGFHGLRRGREPVKVEGDKRSPAGIYRVGRSFGFAASPLPNHLRLTQQTVCVNDVASPAYNTITSQAVAGPNVGGERMRGNPRYRQGLLVDYPTNAAARAGSCIFIHVWQAPSAPTIGCVALSEARVKSLQNFAAGGAVIAILPRDASARMPGCLPAAVGDAVN